jgi:tRNA G46 methylase TrmB
MNKRSEILKIEIRRNFKEIKYRLIILHKLVVRYFCHKDVRTPAVSFDEYNQYWASFWEKRDIDIFCKDWRIYNALGVPVSPFECCVNVIVKTLQQKIGQYGCKAVLEIGSGAGINLLLIASLFPNVKFYGLEPTDSGVKMSREFINNTPKEFMLSNKNGPLKNVTIFKGSILDEASLAGIRNLKIDLIFTCSALEQVHNYLEHVFPRIFSLSNGYFLFCEPWLEGNDVRHYKYLVDRDFFRISWNYLCRYKDIEVLERKVPLIQPVWMTYSEVFCRKLITGRIDIV